MLVCPPMMNSKHQLSENPCKHCGGRLRYKKSGNCVPCVKAAVNLRRGSIARIPLIGNSQTVIQSPPSAFEDLLGDITAPNYEDLL